LIERAASTGVLNSNALTARRKMRFIVWFLESQVIHHVHSKPLGIDHPDLEVQRLVNQA
jgi:hypothetical protein